MKAKLKKLTKYIDDIFLTLGAMFLAISGFLIYIPLGFFILGICFVTYAFIFAKFTGKAR